MNAMLMLVGVLPWMLGAAAFGGGETPPVWGEDGHVITARVAHRTLPEAMPGFFRAAGDRLAYLNPEPDRWRDRAETADDPAMGEYFAADHYLHYDEVPLELLQAPNRIEYLAGLDAAGLDGEEVGTLSFRALELTQRLRNGFRRWRAERDPQRRRWIEERILDDAGILGHYIADAANPHHTTRHHNGWTGPEPRRFRVEPGFHGRFESDFVRANVREADVLAQARGAPRVLPSVRDAIIDHGRSAHARLDRLYELDVARPFTASNRSAEHKRFAVERLAAGAVMLRDIWWTAWVTSR